jgi:hypothetical protein
VTATRTSASGASGEGVIKRGGPDHPKLKALARRLDIEPAHAVGLHESLLHFTARYAARGDVGKFSDEDLAEGCLTRISATKFISALVESKLLDISSEHRLVVHDWPDHCDDFVHIAVARAREFFADGSEPRRKRIGGEERRELDAFYEAARAGGPPAKQCALFFEFPTPDGTLVEPNVVEEDTRAHAVRTPCAPPLLSSPSLSEPQPEERESPDARAREAAAPCPEEIGPPERLTELGRDELRSWAMEHEPWAVPRLLELEHACLDDPSSRKKLSDDWPCVVRAWIRREKAFTGPESFPPGDPSIARGARVIRATGFDQRAAALIEEASRALAADPPRHETIREALGRYRRAPPPEREQPP